jgi:hypothetical protein
MRNEYWVRDFVRNDAAVSEEFTSLPALSVVIIGFSLFILLLTQTYLTYEERMEQIQEYQIVDSLASKLTSLECPFIRGGGLLDLSALTHDTTPLFRLMDQWRESGWVFLLRIHWNNITMDFPGTDNMTTSHRVAVTRPVGVFLNDAQTIPGALTIILWRRST